jgi:hypothetical protein
MFLSTVVTPQTLLFLPYLLNSKDKSIVLPTNYLGFDVAHKVFPILTAI